MFAELTGVTPPKAVTEIKYRDVYNRYALDGAWGRWMQFTFDSEVFSKIVASGPFEPLPQATDLSSPAAPTWWPKIDWSKASIYSKRETNLQMGFQAQSYLWHDTNANVVYLHKFYLN